MPKASTFGAVIASQVVDADSVPLITNAGDNKRVPISELRQVVGPGYSATVNAALEVGATTVAKINAAIVRATATGATRVFVPTSMLPYDASSVSFVPTVQMVREGGSFDVYDLRAYGATGDGVADDRPALNAAANTGMPATGGDVFVPGGTYKLSSDITIPSDTSLSMGQSGKFSIPVGVTLTVSGPVNASLTQNIFSGVGTVVLSAAAADPVSVWWFGAMADAVTDDSGAIQKAINCAEPVKGRVYFPIGRYYISTSLLIPSYITLEGASGAGSIIDNQNIPLAMPQMVNKDAASLIYSSFRKLTFRGGTYGMDLTVSSEMANLVFQDIGFDLQTAGGFRTNKLLQTTSFTNVSFYYCTTGVTCSASTANLNVFINCEFAGLSGTSVSFQGASSKNHFLSCRFEAGGVVGNTVLSLQTATLLTLQSCWFENTHTKLVSETGSTGGVSFDDCRFVGAADGLGGFTQHTWTTDGYLNFGRNSWVTQNDLAVKAFVGGPNGSTFGKLTALTFADTKQRRVLVSSTNTPAANATVDLVTFARDGSGGSSLTNQQSVMGRLWINYSAFENGGFDVNFAREYIVRVAAAGIGIIGISSTLGTAVENNRARTITLGTKAGASSTAAILTMTLAGQGTIDNAGAAVTLNWAWEDLSASPTAAQYITASVA